ncbi:MAG: TRAP transporter substrate-binding protein [Kaiparowitsia implicata GSE-PSE-MK54-09C]|jgi:TRAP-type C4-dicarboxylate transport system substrate-binding protein|nr:TRAP transporter substrate-binding protein [Kaiparowitsia implicata GSE-PSE-MK54-09C]
MKLNRRSIVTAALAGAAIFACSVPAFAQTTLNLSDVLPETNFMVTNAIKFADEVSAATDGQVNISVKAGGSLGFKGPDQLTAVRDGLVEMADINISQQVGVNPLFGVEGVPFLISSMEELKAYHAFVRPAFEALATENNQKILYLVPSPAQYVYLKVEVDGIEDFAGIPVRGADKNTVDIVSAMGMAGVAMPWGELIPALASGRVEGVATSATSGVDGKFWEFMKYIYPTNHTWGSNMVTINLDAWNKLSPEQQAAVEEVAARLEPEFWEVSRQGDIASIKTMTENGMELREISPELKAAMVERALALQADFIARVPEAGPIVEQYKASL